MRPFFFEITTVDGRKLAAREDVNAGAGEHLLAASEIETKFLANADRVMARSRAHALMETLLGIDQVDDVALLLARLAGTQE